MEKHYLEMKAHYLIMIFPHFLCPIAILRVFFIFVRISAKKKQDVHNKKFSLSGLNFCHLS